MISTAITSALVMLGLAAAISLFVAALVKLLFVCVRRLGGDK